MKNKKKTSKKVSKKASMRSTNRKLNIVNCVIIIVLIIIIFSLLRYCSTDNKHNPTGNIDIFDLKCDNPDCPECQTCKPTSGDRTKPVSKEEDPPNPEEEVEGFNVFDDQITWQTESTLRIFTNPAYEFKDIIAPGSSNTYVFRVRNNNPFNVKYSIQVMEENEKSINMKYKLKYKDSYLLGNDNTWVNYDKLNLDNLFLDANKYDEYELEWKWIESDNDTEIGISADASYSLRIEIEGTEI